MHPDRWGGTGFQTAAGMSVEPAGKDAEADCTRPGDPVGRRYKRRGGLISLLTAVLARSCPHTPGDAVPRR